MNSGAETTTGTMDSLKLGVAIALMLAGLWAFYAFPGFSTLLRVVALLVAFGVASALLLQTASGRRFWRFVADARVEVRKVVWPTRQETVQTTLIVIVMVLILGLVLWAFDSVLRAIFQLLVGA